MDPITAILLLLAAAVVLIGVEMLLPTHGILGISGAVSACGAITLAFLQNRWAGAGLLVACLASAPFVFTAMVKVWERSYVGRRLPLHDTTGPLTHERIEAGDVGVTLTELRPMGRAEFGPVDVEVIAQRGAIPPGTRVQVIDYHDGVATVAPVAHAAETNTSPSPSQGSPT